MEVAFAFRRDIQLLRAVAVLLVLGYHFRLPGFANGYLGVDVFFVISGFLMEKLYRSDDGARQFWRRRAARLLPAYFTVVLATLAVGACIVLPDAFIQMLEQARYAAAFASNIGFWQADTYFNPIAFAPFLHLWSLGVELQYYLFVPLIFILHRRWPWALWAMIGTSLLMCLLAVTISPKTAFFLLPFRLWQFGVGIAVARCRYADPILPFWAGPVALAGIMLLTLMPVQVEAKSMIYGHPGAAAILVTLLTGVTLAGCISDDWLRDGAGRVAVWIGDISYSLYLVHFPLIVLANHEPFEKTHLGTGLTYQSLLLLVASIGLAYLLHQSVEKRGTPLVTWSRVAFASSGIVVFSFTLKSLYLSQFPVSERNLFAAFEDRAAYRCGKLFRITHFGEGSCVLRAPGKVSGTILLVGDSHADAIKESFARVAETRGWATALTVSNEPLLSQSLGPEWVISEARRLGASWIALHYYIENFKPSVLAPMIKSATAAKIPLLIIMPVPSSNRSIPAQAFEARRAGRSPPTVMVADYEKSVAGLRRWLAGRPGVRLIEVRSALCKRQCILTDRDGHSLYFDSNHLTLSGARRLESLFHDALPSAKFEQKRQANAARRAPR